MDAKLRAEFGRRVRELRQGRELSLEELAHQAGLNWSYVGSVERGERNPGLESIARLAGGLGISITELFAPFVNIPSVPPPRRLPRRRRGRLP